MKVISNKIITNSEPSTIKSTLQAIKKITKSEKGQQKQPATTGKQPATMMSFFLVKQPPAYVLTSVVITSYV
jgi:hypothetical protein